MLRGIQHRLAGLGQWVINNLRAWSKPYTQMVIVGVVTDVSHSKRDLILENALLGQQLIVVKRQVKRVWSKNPYGAEITSKQISMEKPYKKLFRMGSLMEFWG